MSLDLRYLYSVIYLILQTSRPTSPLRPDPNPGASDENPIPSSSSLCARPRRPPLTLPRNVARPRSTCSEWDDSVLDSRRARRRPRGVVWIAGCRNDSTSLGVGGDGRATVRPDEEETGDDWVSEDICSSEKHAGRLVRPRLRLDLCPQGWTARSEPFSEVASLSSVSGCA